MPFAGPHPKARREAFQELHRQCDFRQQDQHLLILRQRRRDRLEIDFGLARSGDAIQQGGGKFLRFYRLAQTNRRARLVVIQFRRGEGCVGLLKWREFRQVGGDQGARLHQTAHHRR